MCQHFVGKQARFNSLERQKKLDVYCHKAIKQRNEQYKNNPEKLKLIQQYDF